MDGVFMTGHLIRHDFLRIPTFSTLIEVTERGQRAEAAGIGFPQLSGPISTSNRKTSPTADLKQRASP